MFLPNAVCILFLLTLVPSLGFIPRLLQRAPLTCSSSIKNEPLDDTTTPKIGRPLISWIQKSAAALCISSSLSFAALPALAASPATWDSNVMVERIKEPSKDAEGPKVGEMVAIRFTGSYNGNTFDDTFKTDQPYFYRAGVGLIVKGLDDAIVNMKVGEKLGLTFSGDLGFANGKPSSPGKPRIPPGATIQYVVELVDLPGKGDPDALILDDI